MRKGADVLNKWVGESEKQLRQLFEQAKAWQPSIIFFDEIDGAFQIFLIFKKDSRLCVLVNKIKFIRQLYPLFWRSWTDLTIEDK